MANAKSTIIQEKYENTQSYTGDIYCNQSLMFEKRTNRLVAAIDFGTTYSGYAFCFENEMSGLEDPLKSVHTNEWISRTGVSVIEKAPTTVLFDPDDNFHSFGYEAENKYAELVEDEKTDHTKWHCFKQFKMTLHDQIKLKREFEIEDENGYVMPAKKIFASCIKFLKDDLKNTLDNRNPGFGGPSLWVLTVPAIWDEPAKQFMREAAEEAGIMNNMILALEPESAALFCKTLPYGSFYGTSDKELVDCFSPGGIYMVLDLGGGTADTAVHGVRDDCSIKEIHKACGGAWGGTKVDEKFLEHIANLFGNNVVPQLQREFPSEWNTLKKRFEEKKRQVTYLKELNVKLEIPTKFRLFSQQFTRVSDLTKSQTNLKINDENLKRFVRSPADQIEAHVRGILEKFPHLSMIFLVGGFSESQYIQEYLREKFPEKRIIVPLNARMAVLKGAVIIGFNELKRLDNPKNTANLPFQVMERICRWTYGVFINVPFIEGKHLEEYAVTIDGRKYCANIFDVFVKEGESVSMFEERSHELASSHKEKVRRNIDVQFQVFASKGDIPTYTTADNCQYLGKIIFKPPMGGWPELGSFLVTMYFGKTEFSVKVCDLLETNREPYISTYDFLE